MLQAIEAGIVRPGALERHIAGISTKVLSERLRKLHLYGLIEKRIFPETPPRTEFTLTPAGQKLSTIIRQIHSLDEDMAAGASANKFESKPDGFDSAD